MVSLSPLLGDVPAAAEQRNSSTEPLADLLLEHALELYEPLEELPLDSIYRLPPEMRAQVAKWGIKGCADLRLLRALNREFYYLGTPDFWEVRSDQ